MRRQAGKRILTTILRLPPLAATLIKQTLIQLLFECCQHRNSLLGSSDGQFGQHARQGQASAADGEQGDPPRKKILDPRHLLEIAARSVPTPLPGVRSLGLPSSE